ncbi:lipase esterase, partial [Fusarium albosuccineum]
MPFTLDPEFAAAFKAANGSGPSSPSPVGDVKTRRDGFAANLTPLLVTQFPRLPAVSFKDFYTTSADGHQVLLRWHFKPGRNPGSAFLYIHGGGLIRGDIAAFDGLVDEYVEKSGVPYLSVEYRLAPEHRYPKALEDVYAGLTCLHANASELSVNSNRIGIHGESAGGGLAAALAIYAREKQGPSITKQILIYPMLDDRIITPDVLIKPYLVWSGADNETGWDAYLGDKRGTVDVPATAAAARLRDPAGLPPLYAEVGELDLFRDQIVDYVQKFLKA